MTDKNDWLYEGQHGFRPGYSCESHVITVCQNIADCLDEGGRYRCHYNRHFKGFRFISLIFKRMHTIYIEFKKH